MLSVWSNPTRTCCLLPTEAGSGLWTTRDYSKSDLLTEYSGTYITHEQALQLRADNLDSHVRVVSSFHLCIDGIKEPRAGLGGASFCNDARNSKINNAVFTTRSVAAGDTGRWRAVACKTTACLCCHTRLFACACVLTC